MINNNSKYFFHLTDESLGVKRNSRGENFISLSELKAAYFPNVVNSYSIKLSLAGTEYYKINRKEFVVPEMKFLTATSPCESLGFFESKTIVKGLCVDIDINLINQACHILSPDRTINLDNSFLGYFHSKKFFNNVYSVDSSELGKTLIKLYSNIISNGFDSSIIDDEFFLQLAELAAIHEFENLNRLNSLSSSKLSTKKEILKRLLTGKDFIDSNFRNPIDIKQIAAQCCLSEFHFFRSFKEVFGTSPHNYILKRRLNEAKELLNEQNYSVGEIAHICGFADIHSFSKSFKKNIGISPTKFLTKN